MRKMMLAGICVVVCVLTFVAHAKLAVIVFQPTPTYQEGATLIITRDDYVRFIDSGLAWCARARAEERGEQHCLEKLHLAYEASDRVLLELPYSEMFTRLFLGRMAS
jgi:hypothetical protein